MATTRTYSDACGIARALDVVGERWALLVVRELFLGPLRFSDLERALPGASTNMLSDRLRELTENGIVIRHRLPPPAGTVGYELTDWGRELEPVVLGLGAWGLRVPKAPNTTLSATSVLLFLRGSAVDTETPDMVIRLVLDERTFTVTVRDGRLQVAATEPGTSDVSLTCRPTTFYDLLCADLDLDTAVDDGRAAVAGDPSRLRALIASVPGARPEG